MCASAMRSSGRSSGHCVSTMARSSSNTRWLKACAAAMSPPWPKLRAIGTKMRVIRADTGAAQLRMLSCPSSGKKMVMRGVNGNCTSNSRRHAEARRDRHERLGAVRDVGDVADVVADQGAVVPPVHVVARHHRVRRIGEGAVMDEGEVGHVQEALALPPG